MGLGELASLQLGVAHRQQLEQLGISRGSIAHRVTSGNLHPLFPAVFAVGHRALSAEGWMLASLLYAGDDTALSHLAAAALSGLVPATRLLAVTVAGRNVRSRPDLIVHRVARLELSDVRLQRALPVTAPARTIIDCAAGTDDDEVVRMLAEGRVQGLLTDGELAAALARNPLRPGSARVRRLLEAAEGTARTRSDAERDLMRLMAQAGLPRPETNVRLLGFEVDFLWPEARLVIEMDGFAAHGHRGAFERDRRRDQVLTAAGYRVIRVTWRQLCEERVAVVARIAQALVVR